MKITDTHGGKGSSKVNCARDAVGSLVEMFVDIVQQGRIARGQCPVLRPVFLKPHGVAHGTFRVLRNTPKRLRIGLFAGSRYPVWARFSSDTLPTAGDYKTTVGIGLKLFDTPTPKIFGIPDDNTFDFILQNMDVFFVDTARDMCSFTRAGVIDGDYEAYLKKHPRTARILDAMARPVGSCLATPYWGGLPFALGPDQAVKYKLEPTIEDTPPATPPNDPTYLAADLQTRLSERGAKFRFMVQLRTNPKTMPLDKATVRWPERQSPFVHVANVEFPPQDISSRGQAEYGENLSYNIWRVTGDHRPIGSIAEARREVYAASADKRRSVNGVPDGEPATPRRPVDAPACADDVIVRAQIHPGIGIARIGDARKEFYIGPEVPDPPPADAAFYRDRSGALKREAARFRLYGYNAAGQVVRELTPDNADIQWSAHLANRKADWYQFITAMDIPETSDLTLIRRNSKVPQKERGQLVIDSGSRTISGVSASGKKYAFDSGKFRGRKEPVYLGELQTDERGRLLVLGGRGLSESPCGALPFDPKDPDSFNNANDWFDDVADGPVDATVSIDGKAIPVEGSWVVVAPPNYAPDIVGWRTLYDLLTDVYIGCGWLPVPAQTSFSRDVLPQLQRLSNLQWVNKGFYTMFGRGNPMDFEDRRLLEKLSREPAGSDPYGELRRQICNAFRPHDPEVNEPRIWPWIYGDDFGGSLFAESPRTMLALPGIQQLHLQRWAGGDFVDDYDPKAVPPADLADVPLQQRPGTLDKAALHFCLADAFHPGCEMTWPMRHATLYSAPFRIRRRPAGQPEPDYGSTIDQATILSASGPLHGQSAGDISRWMGLPWQGDTAYCRSGYDSDFDLYLPTFWPARVPNTILTRDDYKIVMNTSLPREERIAAYNRRASWYRFIDVPGTSIAERMERMIAHFGAQGIVEAKDGPPNDPVFPSTIYVENLPAKTARALVKAAKTADMYHVFGDDEHCRQARALRARRRVE